MIYKPKAMPEAAEAVRRRARSRARGRDALLGRPHASRRQAPRRARPLARVRHPGRGPERLAPARRAAAGGLRLLDRRSRLDERDRGERAPRAAREARVRATRSPSARPRSRSRRSANDLLASTTYESVLLALKVAFLVLLYLFIWRIVRTAATDLRLPQESFILRPALAGGAIGQAAQPGRLVVMQSARARARATSTSSTPRRSRSGAAARTT